MTTPYRMTLAKARYSRAVAAYLAGEPDALDKCVRALEALNAARREQGQQQRPQRQRQGARQ